MNSRFRGASKNMYSGVTTRCFFAPSCGSFVPPPTLIGEHTIVIHANGRPDILPEGKGRMPLYSFRVNTQWNASSFLTLVGFAFVTYDQNSTILKINADLTRSRVFDEALRFGAGLMAQARF